MELYLALVRRSNNELLCTFTADQPSAYLAHID